MSAGTHAYVGGYLNKYYIALGRWHRSKENLAGFDPYGMYLTNKKWHLNEVNSIKDSLEQFWNPLIKRIPKQKMLRFILIKNLLNV